ncbi:YihY/virulence factor BrkB family protein [filamentous cyanobacterium LEGE 07170]|nr:YihY/virulence factor BrkB family protein [filamentous cyanobacterium LEGE 07170]
MPMQYFRANVLPYIRSTILPSKVAQLFIQTGLKWSQDNCPSMAASLSYFALFSLFPILLIALSFLSLWVRPGSQGFQTIQENAQRLLPPEVYDLVRETMLALSQDSVGAGIVGIGLLIWSSTAVFAVLRNSVNQIWRSPNSVEDASVRRVVLSFAANRVFSFLLVLGFAFALLSSLISNIVIRTVLQLVITFEETFAVVEVNELQLTRGLQIVSSFCILALVAGILFKILPSVYVSWKDVWLGALITALLLSLLQQLVSNSVISIGSRFLSYGVVGSVMVLLLWIFLTFQIFLLGCVLTFAYAHLFGSRRGSVVKRR